MTGRLQKVIEVAGSVDHAMYFNMVAADEVEYEVGFHNHNAITILSELRMPGYSPEQRIPLELSDSVIELVNEG